MKKTTVVRAVAENIADSLMTNGSKEKAARLQLRDANERDLGGLCRGVVIDQIEHGILNFLKSLTVEVEQ